MRCPHATSGTKTHIPLDAGLVHNLVDGVRRDTRPDGGRGDVQYLSRQAAHLAHALDSLGVQQRNLVGPDERSAELGNAILRVVGPGYRGGELALGRQGVHGPQGAGELEGREGVEVAGSWIWLRHEIWREEVAQNTVLLLVGGLVRGLGNESQYSLDLAAEGIEDS